MQRVTRQHTAIRRAFEDAGRPLRPQECLEIAGRDVPDLGIATVYRNIKRLVETGWLQVVELPGGPDRFETADRCHHHHFHCRRCDGVYEIDACPGGFTGMAPSGYRVEDHELILYGVCQSCIS